MPDPRVTGSGIGLVVLDGDPFFGEGIASTRVAVTVVDGRVMSWS